MKAYDNIIIFHDACVLLIKILLRRMFQALPPRKAEALRYLDMNGPKPQRFAKAIIYRYGISPCLVTLTLKVLVATIDAQWDGMGDVGSARYEPALLPPCPTRRVLSYSKVSEIQHFKG